jgi:hypothetical protein
MTKYLATITGDNNFAMITESFDHLMLAENFSISKIWMKNLRRQQKLRPLYSETEIRRRQDRRKMTKLLKLAMEETF